MEPNYPAKHIGDSLTAEMELQQMYRQMEAVQQAERETMWAMAIVLLISGLLVADFMMAFALTDPILDSLAWFFEWVNA